jgi:hypothetical protein
MTKAFLAPPLAWKAIKSTSTNTARLSRTKAAAEKNPRLQPAWDLALHDDVLTWRSERPGTDGVARCHE